MLEICLLGTAAAVPLPERALSAATLRCGGRRILFDCGEGTQVALRREHISPVKIDLIALTHYHGDHCFGLPGLLQSMALQERREPLWITGPADLEQAMAPILALAGELGFPLQLLSTPEEGLALSELHPAWPAGARLRAVPTRHRVPSQGYVFTLSRPGRFDVAAARALGVPQTDWSRLQAGKPVFAGGSWVRPEQVLGPERPGLKLVFSGDTAACRELEEAAAGADLLIHEATYADEEEKAALYGHSTFSQAGTLAARAGVRRLWLYHFSQTIGEPGQALPLAQALFPAAECGYDGLSAALAFRDPTEKD